MPNERSYETACKRSDEIRADLPLHPESYTMLTGDRPTGRLHFGYYFGILLLFWCYFVVFTFCY